MNLPKGMRQQECELSSAIRRIGPALGLTPDFVDKLCFILPKQLADVPAFFCTLDKKWRYEYGEPYRIGPKHNVIATGTDQHPPVRILILGLQKLDRFLSEDQFKLYLGNLSNRAKHLDYLAELDPVLRAKEIADLSYEPRPFAGDTGGPDWEIVFCDGTVCLIEVKHRYRQLLKLFEDLRVGKDSSPHPTKMPVPGGLFEDTERKFPVAADDGPRLHGVWIVSPVWFISQELQNGFDSLDALKIHFLVVGRSWREYEVLARSQAQLTKVNLLFSLPT